MSKHLYLGNLPHECTEQQLRTFIEGSGRKPEAVSIVLDHRTGRSRGFGFAEMSNEEDGEAASQSLQGEELAGRSIRIGPAKSDSRKVAGKSPDSGTPGYEDYGNQSPPRRRRGRR